MSAAKPYGCPTCGLSFARGEHLKRHVKLHTGEKPYHCPCGEAFARNDVLARHLRRCEVGQCNRESLKTPSKARRVRAQRACHQCARAKSKCDFQHPCARCQRRSTDCVYNWERQHETYGLYGPIDSALPAAVSIVGSASSIGSSHPDATEDEYTEISAPSFAKVNDMSCGQLNKGSYWSDESKRHLQAANAALTIDAEVHYSSLLLDPQSTLGFDKESVSVDFDFTGLQDCTSELNAISPNRDMAEPFESVAHPVTQIGTMKGGSLPKTCLLDLTTYSYLGAEQQGPCQQIPQTAPWLGYSLKQTDPVAVKCREISHLLKDPHPLLTERMITEYITRDALLHSCQLYGRYFHRHYPLLHAPTFEVIETPPILLLAVMIAGSCFRGGPIPAVHIPKFAMRLLGLIQNEPHEVEMETPPLSTVLASVITTTVLLFCGSDAARRLWPSCFTRNISMAKRAKLFEPLHPVDDSLLTEETFDWHRWIEQETRRRIGCEIFCQDMACCIFQGRSPTLAPLKFDQVLPSYESCWESKSASECLQSLQTMPQQIRVSDALRLLRFCPRQDAPLFEASAFGMFVLIKALHCVLFQITEYDVPLSIPNLDPASSAVGPKQTADGSSSSNSSSSSSNSSNVSTPGAGITDLDKHFHEDLSGAKVATLADETVSRHGSAAVKHVNATLDAWLSTWQTRRFRECAYENRTFFNDPLPFFWLAKLYLVLHCYAFWIWDGSEFVVSRVAGAGEDSRWTLAVQVKILGWLARFRRQRCRPVDGRAETLLHKVLERVTGA